MFEPPTILVMESFDVEQEKKILRKSFNGKASLAAGVLHILCALVTVATYMYGEYVLVHTPIYAGVWTSLFFLISGIIAIAGSQIGSKALAVATLVTSVLSAISAAILFIIAFFLAKRHNPTRRQD